MCDGVVLPTAVSDRSHFMVRPHRHIIYKIYYYYMYTCEYIMLYIVYDA